jgi:ABC-type oligopeptide transport system ATPase subunit
MQRARTLKTTIGMAFSLGDVIKQGAPLSKLADTVRSQKACVALLGEPGSGKSTTAR